MKHIRLFETTAQQEAATLAYPNVLYNKETGNCGVEKTDPKEKEFVYFVDNNTMIDLSGASFDNGSTTIVSHTMSNNKGVVTLSAAPTKMEGDCFRWNTHVTSVVFPKNLTYCTFSLWQTSITSIDFPSGLTVAPNLQQTQITELIYPSGVTDVGYYSVAHCTNLSSVTLPTELTKIQYNSFWLDTALTSITIPSKVTEIMFNAFLGCSNLATVTCLATTPPSLGNDAFGSTALANIYVPSASVDAYKVASGWSNFASIISAIPE